MVLRHHHHQKKPNYNTQWAKRKEGQCFTAPLWARFTRPPPAAAETQKYHPCGWTTVSPSWQLCCERNSSPKHCVKTASVLMWLQPYFILRATNTTWAPFLLSHGPLQIAKHKNITVWITHCSQSLCELRSWFLQAYIAGNTACKWKTSFTDLSSEWNSTWRNTKVHLNKAKKCS